MIQYNVLCTRGVGGKEYNIDSTIFRCQADDIKHAIEQAENAYPDHVIVQVTPVIGSVTFGVRLTIELDYSLNGTTSEEIISLLEDIPKFAANRGLFSGETPATVDSWSARVEPYFTSSPAA